MAVQLCDLLIGCNGLNQDFLTRNLDSAEAEAFGAQMRSKQGTEHQQEEGGEGINISITHIKNQRNPNC